MKQQTIITHKVSDYTYNDRIEIPVIFSLTDDGKRVYNVETMQDIFDEMIKSIKEHEKNYE
tara:strand:+ start:61 stop:243 length:183 start_codon:yes stop_codon:yes gene_type:complete